MLLAKSLRDLLGSPTPNSSPSNVTLRLLPSQNHDVKIKFYFFSINLDKGNKSIQK